jgi:hypothetical protein
MTLETKGFSRYFIFLVFPVFLFVGIKGVIEIFRGSELFPKIFIMIWISLMVFITIKYLKMITRIDLSENLELKFNTIIGKIYILGVKDITSIKVNNGMIEFKTRQGNFISMGSMDGFSEFVVALKQANSDLITKGC